MNVQRLTLDLDKSSVPRGRVTIAQCDHDGTTVEAEIYDNGIALSTSGLSAYLVMRLPDGRHYYRVPATLDGHVATALVDEAYAATATGTTEIAYFELVGSGGVVYSTSRFGVRVLPSATADATVPETWDGEVERLIQQLDDAIETATDAANVANAAAANADATADGVESRVQEMAQDAAETATADAEQRIQDAIDAMGDISELAVPLMSADVRGGAKLEEHGGLVLRDEKLGIGNLVQESDGYARGGLAEVTAKGHAEQDTTVGKNLCPRFSSLLSNGITFTTQNDGSVRVSGTAQGLAATETHFPSAAGVTYTASVSPNDFNGQAYMRIACRNANGTALDTGGGIKLVDVFNTPKTFTTPNGTVNVFVYLQATNGTTINATFYPQLELGSTATEYEPYTGGAPSPSPDYPQEIKVVRGRNLFGSPEQVAYDLANKVKYRCSVSVDSDSINITATGNNPLWGDGGLPIGSNYSSTYGTKYACKSGEIYCVYFTNLMFDALVVFFDSSDKVTSAVTGGNVRYIADIRSGQSFTCPDGASYFALRFAVNEGTSGNTYTTKFQLTLGSTPQPYVPYGHVGLEVRDANDQLLSTTPIPLPSRGWVGSLPDGTADVLTLDGAGKVEWEENVGIWHGADVNRDNIGFDWASNVHMFRVSDAFNHGVPGYDATLNVLANRARNDIKASVMANAPRDNTLVAIGGTNYLFFNEPSITKGVSTAQQIADWLQEMELYLPLATPVTEELGYIDPPSIDGECQISIPELDALGVKYFVDDSVTEYGRQMYARAYAELGDAITELAARVAALES